MTECFCVATADTYGDSVGARCQSNVAPANVFFELIKLTTFDESAVDVNVHGMDDHTVVDVRVLHLSDRELPFE
jgi:hypothetical protein